MIKGLSERTDLAADALIHGVLARIGGEEGEDKLFLALLDLASSCAPLLIGSRREQRRAAKRLYSLAKQGGF